MYLLEGIGLGDSTKGMLHVCYHRRWYIDCPPGVLYLGVKEEGRHTWVARQPARACATADFSPSMQAPPQSAPATLCLQFLCQFFKAKLSVDFSITSHKQTNSADPSLPGHTQGIAGENIEMQYCGREWWSSIKALITSHSTVDSRRGIIAFLWLNKRR